MSDINPQNSFKPNAAPRLSVRIAECALLIVLMVVSAFIRIPIPYVPITFQTVVAVLAGLLLGAKWGAASVAIYVFMGLLGLPVFTAGGGFAYVFELTFGYILGFVAAAFFAGLARGKGRLTLARAVVASLIGVAANYIVGIPYFMLIWKFYMHLGGMANALIMYNLIYIPKDVVLSVLAAVLAERVAKLIAKR